MEWQREYLGTCRIWNQALFHKIHQNRRRRETADVPKKNFPARTSDTPSALFSAPSRRKRAKRLECLRGAELVPWPLETLFLHTCILIWLSP